MKGWRVDVLIVLDEIEAALERLVDDAAVVAARQPQLRLGGRAKQRPPELIQPLALDDDARGRTLEGLQIRHRDAHVLEPQCLDGLEAEHVADDRGGQVGDRAFLEQVEVIGNPGEVLLLGPGTGSGVRHRLDLVGLGAIELAGGQPVGPHDGPGGGGGLARNRRGGLRRIHTRLRGDAEDHHEIGFEGHVVRLPVTHFDITQYSCLVALGGCGGGRGCVGADGADVRHSSAPGRGSECVRPYGSILISNSQFF